ncbi:hypothetical protein D9M69_699420 [compost metagenome]
MVLPTAKQLKPQRQSNTKRPSAFVEPCAIGSSGLPAPGSRHTETGAPASAAPLSRSVTRTCVAVVAAMNFELPSLGQSRQSVLICALVPSVKRIMPSVATRLAAGS